ncbi:metallophosphoesterase [Streptomyces sp. NA04227]|uniref:metallophosphoesterase family protein n=1 Tax=Streptomyces sp. NA04227 TaxID=2742136 RepID=UPI001C37720D|nr:metallophosphoesterase [Streptomyces sp. NA04227]
MSRRTSITVAATAAAALGGSLVASNVLAAQPSEATPDVFASGVQQIASPGTDSARLDVRASGASAGRERVCAGDGARWIRLGFEKLTLRGQDSLTLTGSDGGRYTLTSRNWQGRAFHTRAFEGGCVTVTPHLKDKASRFAITAYQSGERPLAEDTVNLAAAGDICGTACDQTAAVVDKIGPQALITAGDNAYEDGTIEEFEENYDPNWGKFNSIVRPSPGNHEYHSDGKGYFEYYGKHDVPTGEDQGGYYSFDVGDWHMVALNSNVDSGEGSEQEQWLREDLAASTKPCTMAYWHHPRFSSGAHSDNSDMSALYTALTDNKADVVVNGHDHHYERFAPALADGTEDAENGLRQFVIGTGGRALYSEENGSDGPSEKFQNDTFGVGQFQLTAEGYSFEFKPVEGRTFTDSVEGTCHAKGSGSAARG